MKCSLKKRMMELSFTAGSSPDISPEERAQNVGRVLQKEAEDVRSQWELLNGASADWQRRLELALQQLTELQEAQDLLDAQLKQAEMVKEAWEPVQELSAAALTENIDRVKVRPLIISLTLSHRVQEKK